MRIYCIAHVCMLSHFSCVQLFATLRTVARQASLSMGFSRQEYWSGLPFPSPGDLPNQGIESRSPALAGGFFTTEPPGNFTFAYENVDLYSYTDYEEGIPLCIISTFQTFSFVIIFILKMCLISQLQK